MKRKDIFLVISAVFMIIALFIVNNIINKAKLDAIEIYVNNEIYKTISINSEEDLDVRVGDNYNHIKVHDGGVEIVEASCKDKVCVHSGFINKPSERIVCMPNKVVIKIKTSRDKNNKEDIISK
ncbi:MULTISPECIES: NusG domain II-containing protein [unclassified Romboutsia]|uniref:NusG domain II-containing protein n=1 Tax=unclassified Romboutsia TaxID=2626894 RepID=UPI000820E1C1|nr:MULTISPECIES: NusG domain II-containing protein [unclassified Romboutsia]SCH36504.1 Uncharacterized protein conserved in bacteria [uncultured Clostridium sp.]